LPLVNLKPFLEDAKKNKYCLGCFNVFNIETLEGVIEAAVNKKTPIVCAVYEPHFKYGDLEAFSNLVKEVASKTNIPVVLHLDHAEEISSIVNAIKCGFTSLMFDGPPGISFEEKIKSTKKVVEIAHSVGLMVETELGYITRVGIDERLAKENIADPDLAIKFVEETGVDILAPAIGSIHGMGEQEATLNLDLLRKIIDRTNCYLSLHGGSGVNDSIVRQAINIGINKASVFTRISNRAVDRMRSLLYGKPVDISLLMNELRVGFREVVEERLEVFRSVNICRFETNICNYCPSSKYCAYHSQKDDNISNKPTDYNTKDYQNLVERIVSIVFEKLRNNT
jgi:fructose-bisphosphate aldolase class II